MWGDIEVVIPVMRWDLARSLIINIASNTIEPKKVLLVANATPPPGLLLPEYFSVYDPGKNIGVNAAWNQALISCHPDRHLCFLNDDVSIGSTFFENTLADLDGLMGAGVICPRTLHDRDKYEIAVTAQHLLRDRNDRLILKMEKREGWAFTVNKALWGKIPLIPKELFVFCGDDWIWEWTHFFKFNWFVDVDTAIFHHVGGTLRRQEHQRLRALLRSEKAAYRTLIRNAIG